MVSDHIIEVAKSDGSYFTEYETALKHACATTLPGKTTLTHTNEGRSLPFVYTASADTVRIDTILLMEPTDNLNVDDIHAHDG